MAVNPCACFQHITDNAVLVDVRIGKPVDCLCRSRVSVYGCNKCASTSLDEYLVFAEIVAHHLIGDMLRFAAFLVSVRLCGAQCFHALLEGFNLLGYFVGSVGVLYVSEDRYPLVHSVVVFKPNVMNTYCVAWVVEYEVEKTLFHKVAVSLTYCVVGHHAYCCNRIIGHTLTAFCLFHDAAAERAVLAREIAIDLLTRGFVPTAQGYIVVIHSKYLLVSFLADDT